MLPEYPHAHRIQDICMTQIIWHDSFLYCTDISQGSELNFGGLPYAIFLRKGSRLDIESVNLTGTANPALYANKTADNPYGKYSISALGMWPSITAEPGAEVGHRAQPLCHTQYVAIIVNETLQCASAYLTPWCRPYEDLSPGGSAGTCALPAF